VTFIYLLNTELDLLWIYEVCGRNKVWFLFALLEAGGREVMFALVGRKMASRKRISIAVHKTYIVSLTNP
jgi:hypothetical protein